MSVRQFNRASNEKRQTGVPLLTLTVHMLSEGLIGWNAFKRFDDIKRPQPLLGQKASTRE
jgi:hypothetical protein